MLVYFIQFGRAKSWKFWFALETQLIGLPGREKEVLLYPQLATYWLAASLVCEIGVVSFLVPLIRFISEDARASSFGVRLGCAIIAAPVLTWLIGSTMSAVAHWLHGRS